MSIQQTLKTTFSAQRAFLAFGEKILNFPGVGTWAMLCLDMLLMALVMYYASWGFGFVVVGIALVVYLAMREALMQRFLRTFRETPKERVAVAHSSLMALVCVAYLFLALFDLVGHLIKFV